MFLKAHVEVEFVEDASCQQSAYETYANMLDGAVGMQMILPTIFHVRLVAGFHVQAQESHEH